MSNAKRMEWARELLADCEEAIAAQQRLIDHDGSLVAHQLSFECLTREKQKIEAEIAAMEASDADCQK